MSGITRTGPTLALGTNSSTSMGSITIQSNVTLTGASGTGTFSARGATQTLTTAGVSWPKPIAIDRSSVLSLGDTLLSTSSITNTQGTFTMNNQDATIDSYSSSNSNTRTCTLGSGTLTLTGTGTAFTHATSTGLTVTATTGTIKFTGAAASVTFAGGSKTYNNLWFAGANTNGEIITGTNTFADVRLNEGTVAHTLTWPNVTTTVTSLTIAGVSGAVVTMQRTGGSGTWTVSDTAGTNAVQWCSISNSTASGGATFNATDTIDGGGNTGWNITAPASNSGGFLPILAVM
jgi:hypothetical protein